MARQTRRRRDSKSKNRYRPRLSSASGRATSEKSEVMPRKVEKVDWTTVFILLAIFLFSLYIRTAWTLEPATEDGFQLTGGSDPYYHKHVVDYVAENGEHLERDPMLNYPYGANNNRPPLFDWSIAIIGLALSPFFGGDTEESVWWSMQVLPAIYGALIIFPVYAIGRAQFGKEAGIIGAFFIGVNSQHVGHSSLALADHDSYIILFGTTAYFFFMRALTVANDKKWVSNWRDNSEIKKGISQFIQSEKLALGYAGLAGMTITMISMSWKGFPYIMAIIAIYLGLQMLVNAFRRVDSLTTAALGLVTLSMPVIISYPYYNTMGFVNTWWEAPAYILLGYVMMSLVMVTTRDLPWLLVIGVSTGIATVIYLLLTYVFEDLGFLLFSGQGYFVRTKLFNTIAEAQPPEFADFVFAFGPVSIWLAIFGVIWMAYQLFNQSIWKKDYLFVMTWALVSIYMAQSAIRFIFNATPVVSLISGWITWLLIQRADFPSIITTWKAFWGKRGGLFYWLSLASIFAGIILFFTVSIAIGLISTLILLLLVMVVGHMDAQSEDQYRFRDRIRGLRQGFDMKRPLIALFVGLFIFLPNTFYGYDAGVPYEDKKSHDSDIFEFLSYDFLRPEEYDWNERNNQTKYPDGTEGMYAIENPNQLWYMGNTGPSFPSDYWIEGLEWLAEQDTNLEPEKRPGFISWWDYGFWAIDIGEHPTVADNFQFGYQIAGNFIASQSEHEAMTLLLYRLIEPEVDRKSESFGNEIRTKLLIYLSEENVTKLENIISNPDDYIPKKADGSNQDVHPKNAAIRAGKPILMTIEKNDVADLMWEVEQITGNSIRYYAADTRLMPYSAGNTGILYAPVTLADYDIGNFVEVQAALSNGQTLPFDEAIEVLEDNPDVQVTSQELVYKDKFLNSMFFRSFIGWSAIDVDRPIEDGIPSITGVLGQDQSLPPLPGWNLTHFKLVQYNSGLRILKYYDGATIYGTVATPDGDPIVNANVTVLDEYRVPHGRATTDKNGDYSVLAPAGNLTLAVSMGTPEADIEKIFKSSNNILVRKENVIISEEQAMRQTTDRINIDLEVEPSSIAGRLFWDNNKDETFDSDDDTIPLVAVTALNIRSDVSRTVTTDSNGNYEFTNLAPGEYEITAEMDGHTVELASYTGTAALQANQDVTVKGALEPGIVWGKIFAGELDSQLVTVSLYDETNKSTVEKTFLNTYYYASQCTGDSVDDSISFCFNNLLPGNYTLRFESDDIYTGWTNNTKEIELAKGQSRSFNATLMDGFRIEGLLSHNNNPISNEQITVRNVNEQFSDNIFTTEEGYFATVVPEGTYDIYTVHQTEQTTLAYLDRIDSQTHSGIIDAAMGPGYTITGTLFEDLDGDKKFNPDSGEKTYDGKTIRFISDSGVASVTSTFGGNYEIIIPEGDYDVYSHALANAEQNLVALRGLGTINGNLENVDLAASIGHDAWMILYEEHMGETVTLEGIIDLSTTEGDLNVWATDPISKISLPDGEYQVDLNKFGYELQTIYYGPEEDKEETEKINLQKTEEIIILAKRIPTSVDGRFVYDGNPIANANLSFTPINNPLYHLNFTTDNEGYFDNVELPPEQYMYTFSLEDSGTRYLVHGQMSIPIGAPDFDMGDVSAELRYQVSGETKLLDEAVTGMVVFTPVDDFNNVTVLESTTFAGYNGFLLPGDYYVTFQDGFTSKHYSHGSILNLNAPAVQNLELKDEGFVRGDVRSQADNNVITDRSVQIQFISQDTGVVFIENSEADEGLFGVGEYGRVDLPNGIYDVIVNEEGYQDFTNTLTIDGNTDYYNEIVLIPKTVNVTLEITYINATGNKVPLENGLVIFEAVTGETFANYTDENGQIIFAEMVPKTYEISMNTTLNDGDDQFKLNSQNIYVKAGRDQQTFKRQADWEIRVSGTIFYDRNFDGIADSNEILSDSKVDIWNVDGTEIKGTAVADSEGKYEIYLDAGAYKTWFYTTSGTSYVSISSLELESAQELSPSLVRGIDYTVTYLDSDNNENINFGNVEISGDNFTFTMENDNGQINMLVPSGIYQFSGNYEDLSETSDYAFVLDKTINITDEIDGIDQIETVSRQLMRGIEVLLDSNEQEIPVSQTAIFTFNVTSLGFLDVVFETGIDEIPEGWSAEFAPNKLSMKENETKEVELRITPNENVVPGVWETFFVEIFWSDYEDNDIDDLRREFAVTVDPIEQPEPDFTIETGDFVWTPDYPTVGTEVTISATLTNLVNYSGAHYVPVVFYANDEPIKMVTAEFDGNNSEVTVSATWNATRGTHAIKAHIDPENAITEQNTDNNKASTTFSISETDEEENNSFTVIALAVGVLVAGFVYISYRSRR